VRQRRASPQQFVSVVLSESGLPQAEGCRAYVIQLLQFTAGLLEGQGRKKTESSFVARHVACVRCGNGLLCRQQAAHWQIGSRTLHSLFISLPCLLVSSLPPTRALVCRMDPLYVKGLREAKAQVSIFFLFSQSWRVGFVAMCVQGFVYT